MTPRQRRRLQLLWRRWMKGLATTRERDRALRHAYIEIVTRGRARETNQLTAADAALAIRRLVRATRRPRRTAYNYILGTAGRRGFGEYPEVRVTPPALGLLERTAGLAGLSPASLDRFIARHYAGVGLRRRSDIHTMADLNRVLWGLRGMLRRRGVAKLRERTQKRAA
jgi:hypothetical protein